MTTQQPQLARLTEITDGPSKWGMILSLFEGKEVTFTVKSRERSNPLQIVSLEMKSIILSIARGHDPNESRWVVGGAWYGEGKATGEDFTILFDVSTRNGKIVKIAA